MFNLFKKKDKPKPTFMELLERSEYFEFTEKENLRELKMSIQSGYDKYRTFNITSDSNRNPTCSRAFFCDSETVFEGFGFREQLNKMSEGIEKVCNYNDLINQIPESYDYEANPNGDWFNGVADFTKRVNHYLVQNKFDYKFYPAYGGNEGSMYILNEFQYLLLNKAIKDEHTRPMELDEWINKCNPISSQPTISAKASTEELKVWMQVKHVKFGDGQILEIDEKGVANIKFAEGERRIILKYEMIINEIANVSQNQIKSKTLP